jgi:S1-C subfamily serine protease
MRASRRDQLSGAWPLAALLVLAVLIGYALGHLGTERPVAATTAARDGTAAPAAPAAPAPSAPTVPAVSASPAEPETLAAQGSDLSESERTTVSLFERCSPSVAYIAPLHQVAVRTSPSTVRTQLEPTGTGSGVVWDSAGHIVTNFHVIAGAQGALVTLSDRSTWEAKSVQKYAAKDLAVLKIEAPAAQLRPMVLGSSSGLKVGQEVYAIGNPYGLDFTLTHGIVSALGREIDGFGGRLIQDVIQSDAAINPGNSGGPLLDASGRLVGINTMIFSTSGASAGIGFAVPVDDVRRVVDQLIKDGKVTRPGLGVLIGSDQEIARYRLDGVPLRSVAAGSPAERAGLRGSERLPNGGFTLGDVILKVGEVRTPDTDRLRNALERLAVGETVTLTVQRGTEFLTVDVTLQAVD